VVQGGFGQALITDLDCESAPSAAVVVGPRNGPRQNFARASLMKARYFGDATRDAPRRLAVYLGLNRNISSGPQLVPGRIVTRHNLVAFNLVVPLPNDIVLNNSILSASVRVGLAGALRSVPTIVNAQCPPRV